MKRVLIITSRTNIEKYNEDLDLVKIISDLLIDNLITVNVTTFTQLTFGYLNGEAFIKDLDQNFDLADFNLVIFRRIGNDRQEFSAAILYCDKNGIARIDTKNRPSVGGKLFTTFLAWKNNIFDYPETLYGTSDHLAQMTGKIRFPAIFKAIDGSRGEDNYLVHSIEEVKKIATQNHDKKFLLQEYIPNNGDYRILVLNYETAVVSLRTRTNNNTHVNNVSAGGKEEYITDISQLNKEVELAKKIALVHQVEIAGVDIITNSQTGKPYIMEVNTAPGMTLTAEIEGYANSIRQLLSKNHA